MENRIACLKDALIYLNSASFLTKMARPKKPIKEAVPVMAKERLK